MTEVDALCRLCSASVKKDGMSIFGDRGQKCYLPSKIKLYLHFSVSESDDLPKVLCTSCFRKLESIHRFASMALCMQDRLRSRLGLDALQSTDVPSPLNLLRSVQSEQSAKSFQSVHMEHVEEEEAVEPECEVMEMEINPMSILYPGDENGSCSTDEKPDEPQEFEEKLLESNHPKMPPSKFQQANKQKPYICMYCSRGFILELSLWNHMWIHKDRSQPHSKFSRIKNSHLSRLNCNYSVVPNKRRRKRKAENKVRCSETEENNYRKPNGELNNVQREDERQNSMESEVGSNAKTEDGEERKMKTETENHDRTTESKRTENLENFFCGVCRKKFESQNDLETHLKKHYVEGKFGCSICYRVFKSKESLEQHETNHEVRDYICEHCGRVYASKSSLSSHLVTHSDVRPHKCALCPKTFKRNQDLKFHLNQHTGERPYLCPFCPKAFASSGNCFSHRKRMHPQENKQAKIASGVANF